MPFRKGAITVSLDNADRLEKQIMPPMAQAVTLPILINGKRSAASVYVCSSGFALGSDALSDKELLDIAAIVGIQINRA